MKTIYKTVDLFGNETVNFINSKKSSKKTIFDDYDGFVDKFKIKKTTDDCVTPDKVYRTVLNYVAGKFDLKNYEIIRPFYPSGDYEILKYSPNCVVIDNPPFSIISKIIKFYVGNDIKFFLFAPHLTLFNLCPKYNKKFTAIIVGNDVVYENGAKVKTSFVTNLFGDIRILTAPDLYRDLNCINKNNKINLPKYKYPKELVTVSMFQKFTENGIKFEIKNNDCKFCRELDSQKKHKKGIFGSGFLLSEKAAAEKAAAEKAAAEKAAAEKAIIWELSERETKIVKSLGVKK